MGTLYQDILLALHDMRVRRMMALCVTALVCLLGWQRISAHPNPDWQPIYAGADRMAFAQYQAPNGTQVDVALALFLHQQEGKEIIGHGQGYAESAKGHWLWTGAGKSRADSSGNRPARTDIIVAANGERRMVLTYYYMADGSVATPAGVKWRMIIARLRGQSPAVAALVLSAPIGAGEVHAAALSAFQDQMRPMTRLVQSILTPTQH